MTRKRKTDVAANGHHEETAVAVLEGPPPLPASPEPIDVRPEPTLQPNAPPPGDDKRKPVVSYRVNSDCSLCDHLHRGLN